MLIDPPFESPEEFSALAQAVRDATRKFATGIFLVWYPIKSQAEADAFTGEVLAGGIVKAMTIDTADSRAGRQARPRRTAGDQSALRFRGGHGTGGRTCWRRAWRAQSHRPGLRAPNRRNLGGAEASDTQKTPQ